MGAKGRKGPRHAKAPKEDEMSDGEISVEEGDIQALARSSLRDGETILGQGQGTTDDGKVESRGICNAPLILQKLQDIEYKAPDGAKRVPWVDTLCIDGWKELPKDVKPKDGVRLESAFIEMGNEAVREAYRRLSVMKVPASRPSDFYAEMLRTDAQMFKVRARASEEVRRIKIVEDRKKAKANKKFQKNARVKKLEDRAAEKRKTLDDITEWRNKSKQDKKNVDDKDLEDILDKQRKPGQSGDDEKDDAGKGKGKKKDGDGKNLKRAALDKKYGFGGKKKWKKSNDASSTNDIFAGRKGKGKGKGKSKGKGKGGGGGGFSEGGKKGGGKKRKRG